jgi:hypothetical protein
MTKKKLDRTQIAGRPSDDRCLGSPKRADAIFGSDQASPAHPFIHETGILPDADVAVVISTAWEDMIVYCATTAFEPCQQTGSSIWQEFEMYRTACFLLHYDRARPDLTAIDDVADLHSSKVAATQLAVDPQVEQCAITQAASFFEKSGSPKSAMATLSGNAKGVRTSAIRLATLIPQNVKRNPRSMLCP